MIVSKPPTNDCHNKPYFNYINTQTIPSIEYVTLQCTHNIHKNWTAYRFSRKRKFAIKPTNLQSLQNKKKLWTSYITANCGMVWHPDLWHGTKDWHMTWCRHPDLWPSMTPVLMTRYGNLTNEMGYALTLDKKSTTNDLFMTKQETQIYK